MRGSCLFMSKILIDQGTLVTLSKLDCLGKWRDEVKDGTCNRYCYRNSAPHPRRWETQPQLLLAITNI